MTTAVERHLAPSQLSSDSEGSTSEEETGRFKIKSAVVQATKKDSHSPSSSLSRTPSPLPHATFSAVPPLHRGHSPSPPPRPGRRRDGSRSPSPPSRRYGRRRSRSYSPRDRRESPRWDRRERRDQARTPSPRRKERVALEEGEVSETEEPPPKKKKEELDPILTRTGGAYIPPAKLRMMQSQIQDKSSVAYQRLAWEALKKSINGLINKVNVSNIGNIVQELFQENVVRGRGLLIRSVIQAQAASHTFTHVYAALVAIINTKFPQIGELLAKRLILQFRKGFRRNDKSLCVTAAKFLAHLVNQLVLHEIVALELLTLLLEEPTDDSVEVAVGFLKESGAKLTDISPRGVHAVFETLRSVLHSGQVTSRVQYMIEVMFAVRKDKFQEHPAVIETLNLVEEDDQITHLLSLGDDHEAEEILNVFQADDDYLANEEKYKEIKAEILGEESSDSEGSSGDESDEEDSDDEEEEEESTKIDITDKTDAKALTLRRTIYLTIMSSLDYEECAHKLMKTKEDGQEPEIAMMLVECCSQERSYLRFYGLLGQRFCLLNKVWVEAFDSLFQEQYATVHRLETNKLRNVAKFFAQLYYSDALPWTGMYCIHLNKEETNSSSRIFVKILFQELAEFMGMAKLNDRLRDTILSEAFEGLLPRDNPRNTRFAINFFTSIGLGGLTDDLREHLKDVQKQIMAQKQEVSSSDTSDSDSSENDSPEEEEEESSSEESSESESSSTDSEEERKRQRRARKKRKEKEGERSHGRDRGDDRKERGDDREKRRDDKEKRRDDKEKSGEDREKSGEDRKERGDDREKRRDDKEKSGEDRKERGDDREKRRDDRKERGQREERKEGQRGRTKKHGSGSEKEEEWHGERRKKKDRDGSRERDREQSRKEESHSKRRDKKCSSRERKRESEDEETKRRHKGRRRDKREDRNESEEEEDDVRDERKEIRERRGRDQEEGAWERGRRRQGEGRKRDREDRREREGRGDHDRDSHSPRDKRRR